MLDLLDRKTLMASLPRGLVGAEVGVAHGEFSAHILSASEPQRLYLIDSWTHQPAEDVGHDPSNAPQEVQDAIFTQVCRRFHEFPQVVVLRKFSLDAAADFADEDLDWVYLDANHLDVDRDIDAWWPKVRRGGWLMGHDYTVAGDFIRVKPLVDAWVARMGMTLQVAGLQSDDVYQRNYPTWCVQKP